MIAITPDGKTAYVVDGADHPGWGTVTPIATATNTAGKPIRVGAVPQAIAMTPDGKTAYVIGGDAHGNADRDGDQHAG